MTEDEPTDCLDSIGLEFGVESVSHVPDWNPTVDDGRHVCSLLDSGLSNGRAELVLDTACKLLDSHDALEDAPLVDHDGQLAFSARLKIRQDFGDPSRFCNNEDPSCEVTSSKRIIVTRLRVARPEDLLDVDESNRLLLVLVEHEIARVDPVGGNAPEFGERHRGGHGFHARPWNPDLADARQWNTTSKAAGSVGTVPNVRTGT